MHFKGSAESVHPLSGRELRALRRLKREQDPTVAVRVHFRTRFTVHDCGFPQMVERAGAVAGFEFKAHPHMLRHACGFALANNGSRYSVAAGLSGPQEHPAHGALHRTVAGPFQGFLARLIGPPAPGSAAVAAGEAFSDDPCRREVGLPNLKEGHDAAEEAFG